MEDDAKSILQILFCTVAWSAMPFASRELAREISPAQITAVRYTLAGVLIAFSLSGKEAKKAFRADWGKFIVLSLIGITIPQIAYIRSILLIPLPLASFIIGAYPVFAVWIGVLLMGEKPTIRQLAGIAALPSWPFSPYKA